MIRNGWTPHEFKITYGDAQTTIEVWIKWQLVPGSPGRRDSMGVPLEPDEPPEVNILDVRCEAWPHIWGVLPETFWQEVEGEILEEEY